jgi:hypothetical protein
MARTELRAARTLGYRTRRKDGRQNIFAASLLANSPHRRALITGARPCENHADGPATMLWYQEPCKVPFIT